MSEDFQNLSILIVDDEPFILKVLQRILSQFRIGKIVSCESAECALASVSDEVPSIVFCDINMPDMDGLALMRHLVAYPVPPAIVVFSGEDPAVLHTAEQLGVALGLRVLGALSKPFEIEQVEKLLNQYIEAPGHYQGIVGELSSDQIAAGLARGAILPVFQPQVTKDGLISDSVETLLRWRQPDGTVIGPNQIIPVAEKCGQIDAVTKSIMELSLAEKKRWHEAGLDLKLSINISVENLRDLAFGDYVLDLVERMGVNPAEITLEVTESGLIQDVAAALEILSRLRIKGFGLSIDDFSTGAASIQQLRRLPFSELKIDREFVDNAPVDPVKQQMLRSMVDMGRALSLNVVAEGAETREEWDLIAGLGVDYVQGFYIARPMTSDSLITWMKERSNKA